MTIKPTFLPTFSSTFQSLNGYRKVIGWDASNSNAEAVISGNVVSFSGSNSQRGAVTNQTISGKKYWEVQWGGASDNGLYVGVVKNDVDGTALTNVATSGVYMVRRDGDVWESATMTYSNTYPYAINDTMACAYDADSRKFWLGTVETAQGGAKYVDWFNTGDPAGGTGEIFTAGAGTFLPAIMAFTSSNNITLLATSGNVNVTPPYGFSTF